MAPCQGGGGGTATVRSTDSSTSGGAGGSTSLLGAAFDPASTINLEALGVAAARLAAAPGARPLPPARVQVIPDPRDYLEPEDYAQYQRWLPWSEKPRGLDYLRPSREYFSLGKTRAWRGDIAQPGAMKEMLKVSNAVLGTALNRRWRRQLHRLWRSS